MINWDGEDAEQAELNKVNHCQSPVLWALKKSWWNQLILANSLRNNYSAGFATSKWTASKLVTIEQQKQNGSNIFVRPRKNQDGWDTEQKKLKNFNNNVNSNIVRGRCCVHSNETNIICLFWQILQRPAQFYKDIVAVGQGLLWPQLNVQDL